MNVVVIIGILLIILSVLIAILLYNFVFNATFFGGAAEDEIYQYIDEIKKNKDELTLPAVVRANGDQFWYFEGKYHRTDKDENGLTLPAVVRTCDQEWCFNGKWHRIDKDENGLTLPAIIRANGDQEWYLNDEHQRTDRDENGLPMYTSIENNIKRWKIDDQVFDNYTKYFDYCKQHHSEYLHNLQTI